MLAPKKGLLCNLNHIHLQHISLGLHLSRHPELQETSDSMSQGEQKCCSGCQENCEQVDANSNNPSLKCQCCESHAELPVTLALQNQAAQEDFSCLHAGEEVASPCNLASTSSSVSSCSDFSLDDSPVSVYCRGFSGEGSQSPENQPNVIPIEDVGDGLLLADQGRTWDGTDGNLNPAVLQRADIPAGESPDSLCSSSSLNSQYDEPFLSTVTQETTSTCVDLDPNCNPLPDPVAAPPALAVPGQQDHSPSSAPEPRTWAKSIPPPIPPRPRRQLQILNGHRAEQPVLPVKPAEPEPALGDLGRDGGKKNITSFHELAQKRKRNTTGTTLTQARGDRSDWLIIFSPDTELPPSSELLSSTAGQELPRPQLQQEWRVRPPGLRQREVTTFKELRYRSASNKPKGQPDSERVEPVASQHPSALLEMPAGSCGSSWMPPVPSGRQLLASTESHQTKRRRSRPGLQPIAEGQLGDAEEGKLLPQICMPEEKGPGSGCNGEALIWRLGGPGGDPWVPGEVERGDETCKEGKFASSEVTTLAAGHPLFQVPGKGTGSVGSPFRGPVRGAGRSCRIQGCSCGQGLPVLELAGARRSFASSWPLHCWPLQIISLPPGRCVRGRPGLLRGAGWFQGLLARAGFPLRHFCRVGCPEDGGLRGAGSPPGLLPLRLAAPPARPFPRPAALLPFSFVSRPARARGVRPWAGPKGGRARPAPLHRRPSPGRGLRLHERPRPARARPRPPAR